LIGVLPTRPTSPIASVPRWRGTIVGRIVLAMLGTWTLGFVGILLFAALPGHPTFLAAALPCALGAHMLGVVAGVILQSVAAGRIARAEAIFVTDPRAAAALAASALRIGPRRPARTRAVLLLARDAHRRGAWGEVVLAARRSGRHALGERSERAEIATLEAFALARLGDDLAAAEQRLQFVGNVDLVASHAVRATWLAANALLAFRRGHHRAVLDLFSAEGAWLSSVAPRDGALVAALARASMARTEGL
jgi:hypothetical protein